MGIIQPVIVFWSYTSSDHRALTKLQNQLRASLFLAEAQQKKELVFFDRYQISAGTEVVKQTQTQLIKADIIVALLSTDYLTSSPQEIDCIFERWHHNSVCLIPILLRATLWKHSQFGVLAVLPKDGRPVMGRRTTNDVLVQVAEEIEASIKNLYEMRLAEHRAITLAVEKPDALCVQEPDTIEVLDLPFPGGPFHHVENDLFKNIFTVHQHLKRATDFYGRVKERQDLLTACANQVSISIVGPRGIGKTWLLEYLLLQAPSQLGPTYRLGYVNAALPSCQTGTGFIAQCLERLGVQLKSAHPDLGMPVLQEAVQTIQKKAMIPLLCIDEFDSLFRSSEFNINFLRQLRALCELGLVLITASKRDIKRLQEEAWPHDRSSGLFNTISRIHLSPFHEEEASNFFQSKSVQSHFSREEQLQLLHSSKKGSEGWLPVRLQLAGQLFMRDKEERLYGDDETYWQDFQKRLEINYEAITGVTSQL